MSQTVKKTPEGLPASFGRYRLVKLLGEGGMGSVYLAHDEHLDRSVALKIPQLDAGAGAQILTRFYTEARAAAAVHHPNICPIHDVGEIDGIPYLTMAYIEGKSLREFARARPLLPRQSTMLVRKLALALAEAHSHGVIHRDLKPANIMIDGRGEPVIMDFGLARRTNKGDTRVTQQGATIGTPAYMPPEQVAGDIDAMGPSSDIYSLGVILYELLAGRLPFTGDMMVMLSQVLLDEPPPPSQFCPDLAPELEAICLKAMAKKASDRHTSMAALAAELIEYLRKVPQSESGRQPSPGSRQPPEGVKINEGAPSSSRTPTTSASERDTAGIRVSQMGGMRSIAQFHARLPTTQTGERPSVKQQRRKERGSRVTWWIWGGAGVVVPLLMGWIIYQATQKGAIRIVVVPAAAQVEIQVDGGPVQLAGTELRLAAGPHQVTVLGRDYEAEAQSFTVGRGRNSDLVVTLRPKRVAMAPHPVGPPSTPSVPVARVPIDNEQAAPPPGVEKKTAPHPVDPPDLPRVPVARVPVDNERAAPPPGVEKKVETPSTAVPPLVTPWRDSDFWVLKGQELHQLDRRDIQTHLFLFGDIAWTDYDFEVQAQTILRSEFNVVFRATTPANCSLAVFGGWGNKFHGAYGTQGGFSVVGVPGQTEGGRWYRVRVEARGMHFKIFLDGKPLLAYDSDKYPRGCVGLRTSGTSARFRDPKVTAPDGKVLFEGWPVLKALKPQAEALVDRSEPPPEPAKIELVRRIPVSAAYDQFYYTDISKGGKYALLSRDIAPGVVFEFYNVLSGARVFVRKGYVVRFLGAGEEIVTNDGRWMVYGSRSGKLLRQANKKSSSDGWQLAPGGKHLISRDQNGYALVELTRMLELHRFDENPQAVLHFSPDGKYLFRRRVNEDRWMVWDIENNRPASGFASLSGVKAIYMFFPDRRTIFASYNGEGVRLDMHTGKVVETIKDAELPPGMIASTDTYSPSGRLFAARFSNGRFQVFRLPILKNQQFALFELPADDRALGGNRRAHPWQAISEDDRYATLVTTKSLYILRLPDLSSKQASWVNDNGELQKYAGVADFSNASKN